MPIEIRELYIKAVIHTGGKNTSAGEDATAKAKEGSGGGDTPADDFINLCVEKVMEILNDKKER